MLYAFVHTLMGGYWYDFGLKFVTKVFKQSHGPQGPIFCNEVYGRLTKRGKKGKEEKRSSGKEEKWKKREKREKS